MNFLNIKFTSFLKVFVRELGNLSELSTYLMDFLFYTSKTGLFIYLNQGSLRFIIGFPLILYIGVI